MKSLGLPILGLMMLAGMASAPVQASQDLLCVRDMTPGAPSYLLVIKDSNPDGTAIILEKNFSAFESPWQVDYSDAIASRAADGGPLSVVGALDPAKIDWDTPEHANQCFIMYTAYRFNLIESSRGVRGTVGVGTEIARNPNMQPCPTPVEPPAIQFPVTCSDY